MCAQSGAAPTGAASDSSGVFLTPSYSGFYRLFPLHTLSRTQVRCPPEHHILSFFRLVTSHRSGSKAANAAARSRAALWPGFFALLGTVSRSDIGQCFLSSGPNISTYCPTCMNMDEWDHITNPSDCFLYNGAIVTSHALFCIRRITIVFVH